MGHGLVEVLREAGIEQHAAAGVPRAGCSQPKEEEAHQKALHSDSCSDKADRLIMRSRVVVRYIRTRGRRRGNSPTCMASGQAGAREGSLPASVLLHLVVEAISQQWRKIGSSPSKCFSTAVTGRVKPGYKAN